MGRHSAAIALALLSAAGLAVAPGCGRAVAPTQPDGPDGRCPRPGAGISVSGAGPSADASALPRRRLVLMGGGAEDDPAATLFAEGAGGGDVLVLRTTGSLTSYPEYFGSTLRPSPPPASVLTVRTDTPEAGADPAVLCLLGRAEAVWMAGGDQWDYLGRWPGALHDSLAVLAPRGRAVGGTSAGAMALGEAAFDARAGSISSQDALADPPRRREPVLPRLRPAGAPGHTGGHPLLRAGA